jgi:hypothetical protein
MGHASITITLDRYGHLLPETKQKPPPCSTAGSTPSQTQRFPKPRAQVRFLPGASRKSLLSKAFASVRRGRDQAFSGTLGQCRKRRRSGSNALSIGFRDRCKRFHASLSKCGPRRELSGDFRDDHDLHVLRQGIDSLLDETYRAIEDWETIDGRTMLKWRPLGSLACGRCVDEHFVAFGGDD